jgi:Tfp pilus assembly protein PilF
MMKKYLLSALAIALIGASVVSIAQSKSEDHSSHGKQGMGMQGMTGMNHGEMQAMRESMHKKMSAAKTDAERQALMAEQQKLMMEKHAQMMPPDAGSQDMHRMPGNMAERQQMMHKRMGMGM